jgi:hypothetical protein
MKHWRLVYLTIPLTVAVFAAILLANEWKSARPAQGVGRVPEVVRYESAVVETAAQTAPAYDEYVEGEGDAPEWWKPEEPMAAEWEDSNARQSESNAIQRTDAGCPDWNVDSTLINANGAMAERWEIEEAIRLMMLEAGSEGEDDLREHCAVLCKQLEYAQAVGGYDDWGTTMYGVIHSHGYLESYPRLWTEDAVPTERVREVFMDVWNNGYATDFRVQSYRTDYFAEWAIPAYQIGDTYYSINPWQDFSMFGKGE